MKGKLIKTDVNYLLEDDKGVVVASTSTKEGINGLSKQNCDEICGVVDVVYKQVRNGFDGDIDSFTEAFAKECINKAMELYQPTEIEVEIEMFTPAATYGHSGWHEEPKLDKNGCLILKRI
jgi:hypothetical protein